MTTAPTTSPFRDRSLNHVPTSRKTADLARAAARVREARRAGNLERSGRAAQLRCECALPGCRETFPAAGQSYRGTAECFIVVPAHLGAAIDDGTVVGAADRFFVVELSRGADRFPTPAESPTQIAADHGLHPAAWSSSTSRPWVDS
jgi:hypothetical protein